LVLRSQRAKAGRGATASVCSGDGVSLDMGGR
jgi:hypothetical protein